MTPEEILRGEFDIEIPNFKKWNPETHSHRVWFALRVDWWRDPKIIRLSPLERCLWIQLIGLRATSDGPIANLTTTSLGPMMNLRGTSLVPGLIKLLKLQLINLRSVPLHNITVHNKTNITKKEGGTERSAVVPEQPTNATSHRTASTLTVYSEAEPSVQFGIYPELSNPVVIEFLTRAKIKSSILTLWVNTYNDIDWVQQEILKAIAWMDANPSKKPKRNFARFLGSWFSRGWEWHRKTIPSNPSTPVEDHDYIFGRKERVN